MTIKTDSGEGKRIYYMGKDYRKLEEEGRASIIEDNIKNIVIIGDGEHFSVSYKGEEQFTSTFENLFVMTRYWEAFDMYRQDEEKNLYDFFDRNVFYPLTTVKSLKSEDVNGKICYVITVAEPNNGTLITYYIEKETKLPVKEIRIEKNSDGEDKKEMFFDFSFKTITKANIGYPDMSNAHVNL